MTQQTESTNHEVDLDKVSKRVKNVISGINDSVFDGILFIKKHIIIVIVLVLLGGGYGYYKDINSKAYEHTAFVTPNFESADYLYEKVKMLNAKIMERDMDFLAKLNIKDPENVGKIQIDPVIDIYNYVTGETGLEIENRENYKFALFRQIADKRDMTEVLEEQATARHYKSHLITITTGGTATKEELIDPVIEYLNSNDYFKDVQKEAIKSLDKKIAENDSMVKQADAILKHLSETGKGSSTVLLNEKTDLNYILVIKDQLIRQQSVNKVKKIDYSNVIKETGTMLNKKKVSILSNKSKFIYPIMLLALFFAVMSFRHYYKTQSDKRKGITA